jgi:glucokinase
MSLVAGVDSGGTKVLAALVDEEGRIVDRVEHPTDPRAGTASILRALGELFEKESPAAIGVGVAAWVGWPSGRVVFAPNLFYDDPEVKEAIRRRFGLPVSVENDANAAAWGECRFGAGVGVSEMLMVTVGTGIGGGIVSGGKLYRGRNGYAGEFGHMTLIEGGPRCACGERGCFEAMASGAAIGRMAREGLHAAGSTAVRELSGGDSERVTGALVAEAAEGGDAYARLILRRAGHWLGIGLTNLVNIFDPEVIVIGGGGASSGGLLLDPAREELARRLEGRREPPRVAEAALGNDAGVIGAADLARLAV